LLYSNLQINHGSNSTSFRGLGYVDSRKDTLTVTFELNPPAGQPEMPSKSSTRKSRHGRKAPNIEKIGNKTIEIELAQDKTALRTRKGDTGSVLWKARFDIYVSLSRLKEATHSTIGHAASISRN
jgi:hypothetical protein